MNELRRVLIGVGVTGVVDILVMAVLIYGALAWMRSQRMRRLQRGVLMVVALYLAARFFALELTATSLEALLVIVLLAATVLYGAEIRRLVERLFPFAKTGLPRAPSRPEAMARLAFALGDERIGALVVVAGRDDVGAVVEGGTPLDGVWSEPLVRSIFDTGSMGHDGAVVVRDGRVWRFACHLPLSKNQDVLGPGKGTRHAAALGMSEKTDALCIAVSEERGTVTVCEHGDLQELATAEELAARLDRFEAEHRPKATTSWRPRTHLPTALAALLLSALSWLVIVQGARPTERSFDAKVEVRTLSPHLRVQAIHPEQVVVHVVGAGRDLVMAQPSTIRVTVPGSELSVGQHAITLGPTHVDLPRGLSLQGVEPSVISVSVVPR